MMTEGDKLNIQAWLDGEIAPQKSSQIAEKVKTNANAKDLAEELKAVECALKIGEKPIYLDDTREFYWAQIDRQINSMEPMSVVQEQPKLSPGSTGSLMRWLVPVCSLAAIFALMTNFSSLNTYPWNPDQLPFDEETSVPLTGKSESTLPLEDETSENPVGIFSFESNSDLYNLHDSNGPSDLPESIENPPR